MMKKERVLSVLLAAVLLFSIVTPVQTQAQTFSLPRVQTASLTQAPTLSLSQGEKGPQIPGARTDDNTSVNNYDPEQDGYFAYLPILYYESPWNVTDSEKLEGDLPVIVWKDKIFVSADNLAKAAGLDKEETARKIRFVRDERELILTLDNTMASFILGTFKEGLQEPYIQERFALSVAPFTGTDGASYVPLTDVCTILGVDLIATDGGNGTVRYGINPPQRDVYDVLASFRDDDRREGYQFLYEADPKALKKAEVSSRTVLALDGLLKGDKDYALYCLLRVFSSYDYLKQYTPNQFVWNKVVLGRDPQKKDIDKDHWDKILAESLIRDLWLGTENEVLAMASQVVDFTASDLGLLFNDVTDSVLSGEDRLTDTVLFLQKNFKNTSFYMTQNTSLKYQKILDRYEKAMKTAGPKWKALGAGLSGAALVLKTGFAFANDMKAFEGRDQVMDDALKIFLSYGGYLYVSGAAIAKLREEYTGYSQDASAYSLKKAIIDSLSEAVISGIISKGLGLGSLVLEGFKLASSLIPAYQETLDSMVAYQTSLLSIAVQKEAHQDAYVGILKSSSDEHLVLQGAELDKDIQQAYMYLKSCAATRELVQKAFEYQDSQLPRLYQEMTILGHTYGLSGEERPRSYAERIAAINGSDSTFIEQLIPLYVTVSGKVLTWGDEKPVPDAVIEVTEHGQQRVDFKADGEGVYHQIHIPIFWPAEGIIEFDGEFEIHLYFHGEETDGDDRKHFDFQPKAEIEISDAHLLQKGTLEAFVVDKESGDPITEPGYEAELTNPEIYRNEVEVQTIYGGHGDDSGHVIQEKIAPGHYKAVFSAKGYESKEVEFEIESDEVTKLPKVELEKKTLWLIVEEDYQDIANDGFWSVHLYYSYDEEGRLTEIDGERAAQHYRHYSYDEKGLMTEQIEGSTGGFWTGRKYSYDELGRVIRIDSYLLMNTDDWRDASWQENGYQTKRYEGENLAETGYYSDKQTLYYSYTYEYNEAGLLVKEVEWSDGKADRVVVYEYDEQGRVIKSTSSSGRIITVTYEYNEAGQLSKETNLYSEYVTLYFYDEHGNMIREERYSRLGKKLASRTTYTYKQFPFED